MLTLELPTSRIPTPQDDLSREQSKRRVEGRQGNGMPVLVVSPARAASVPMLRAMLRGEPEIEIVVDRRIGERRVNDLVVEFDPPEDAPAERRRTERRRRPSYYLL